MKINEDYLANILFNRVQSLDNLERPIESLTIKDLRELARYICIDIEREEKDDEPPF